MLGRVDIYEQNNWLERFCEGDLPPNPLPKRKGER